jgi:bifunctional non-homologous end joining protein LigD
MDETSGIALALKTGVPSYEVEANSVKDPFDAPDWIFEIKLDGSGPSRSSMQPGKPHLWSRNGLPLEAKFPAVANAVSKLKLRSTILDGEVVAVDENGIPRFQLLQRSKKQPAAPTLYYVFDVLWHRGDDLTVKAFVERRGILERLLEPRAGVQLADYVESDGQALFNLTKEKGMEGIVAKRKDGIYRPGKRSSDWLKIKARLQQDLWLADLQRPKEAENIWVLSCWAPTRMVSCGTTATRVPALLKKA